MNNVGLWMNGMAVGAGLMYALDPGAGRRRRALMRDKMIWAARKTRDAADATGRDLQHRAAGATARIRNRRMNEDVPDVVLLERVRATLGRVVSHPRAIDVDVQDGHVALTGPILANEVRPLLRAVSRVRGICDVEDRLDKYDEPGNVPSLQGESERPDTWSAFMRGRWSPTTKLLMGVAGALAGAYALSRGPAWEPQEDYS